MRLVADVVYLDAKTDTYLEEVSSCNIFVRKGKTIKTPPLGGTILPGKPPQASPLSSALCRGYGSAYQQEVCRMWDCIRGLVIALVAVVC
jgi:hypothetical protein